MGKNDWSPAQADNDSKKRITCEAVRIVKDRHPEIEAIGVHETISGIYCITNRAGVIRNDPAILEEVLNECQG